MLYTFPEQVSILSIAGTSNGAGHATDIVSPNKAVTFIATDRFRNLHLSILSAEQFKGVVVQNFFRKRCDLGIIGYPRS